MASSTATDSMEPQLVRDPLFVALTRPQMFAGVTFSFFIINLVVSTELFLIMRSTWVVLAALLVHLIGVIACLDEPRRFDILLVRLTHCPRVKNYRWWRCNSYRA